MCDLKGEPQSDEGREPGGLPHPPEALAVASLIIHHQERPLARRPAVSAQGQPASAGTAPGDDPLQDLPQDGLLLRRDPGEGKAALVAEAPLSLRGIFAPDNVAPDDPGGEGEGPELGREFEHTDGARAQEVRMLDAGARAAEVEEPDLEDR